MPPKARASGPPPRRHAGAGHAGALSAWAPTPTTCSTAPRRFCSTRALPPAPAGKSALPAAAAAICGPWASAATRPCSASAYLAAPNCRWPARPCAPTIFTAPWALKATSCSSTTMATITNSPCATPCRDMIAASHLRDLVGARGGVHMLDGAQLSPAQRETLARVAALYLEGNAGFYAQLRAKLGALGVRRPRRLSPHGRALGEVAACQPRAFQRLRRLCRGWLRHRRLRAYARRMVERAGRRELRHDRHRARRRLPLWQEQPHGAPDAFLQRPVARGLGPELYLADERRGTYARLLPGEAPFTPFRATHALAHSAFERRGRPAL